MTGSVSSSVETERDPYSPMTAADRKVLFASSLGTVFEWYDFYLYGALAGIIAQQFFAPLDPTAAFIFALLAFATGFIVRPFGALIFGRLGDMVGRKYTFLVTIVLMGTATFLVGILPNYESIGAAAPICLIVLRMLQGLALGGEYGGAAIYVAEHAPQGKRGAYTAWIQTTATLGLLMSLLVIMGVRSIMGEEAFAASGWRIPFLFSLVLLGISVWIRMSMAESPAFQKMKAEGRASRSPLRESFGQWQNLRIVLLALFGLVAGQAVVWYTGQFYTLFFMTSVLKVDSQLASLLIAAALVIGTPFFLIFGALSDRTGRKPIILAGLILACLTYHALFRELTEAANPAMARAQAAARVTLLADPSTCSFQGNPVARDADFVTACDIAKRALAQSGASYQNQALPSGRGALVQVGTLELPVPAAARNADGTIDGSATQAARLAFRDALARALTDAGYPEKADPGAIQYAKVLLILVVLVIYVTMVYGPIAAMLVELFPTRIRYSSMSLAYHIGNGWFGGLMPTIAFAMVAQWGDIYSGLWYPVIVAGLGALVGLLLLRETKDVDIYAKFLYWHPRKLR